MKLLLDSHILLWALVDDPRLPQRARYALMDMDNTLYYSAASVWELTIKHLREPQRLPLPPSTLVELLEEAGYNELPVTKEHILYLPTLTRSADAPPHHDPFDRILLAQAKAEGMRFMTHDSLLPGYGEPCLMMV